jgi:hypothetical protein
LLLIAALLVPVEETRAASLTVDGVTFSDELGGFVLEGVTGSGSMDDPFVIVERMTSAGGGILRFRMDPAFGNRIGSQHTIGFALIKVIENATDFTWNSFELELQSQLGVPSGYADGLSFGQGSMVGRPFTSLEFARVKMIDEPYDQVEFEDGKVSVGGHTTLRIVITESMPLSDAYLAQRPARPLAAIFSRSVGRRGRG